eukprot:TRINITY_DN3160_c0_g1_i1.p1 TRINITY_DN3160_c0_g1~~TRINITY_DN3160_c0_g1_i1.p1  ORF type:complete len:224 (-),score=38.61 TRINITY_DN3160_c0_g1_i1:136-807(-)
MVLKLYSNPICPYAHRAYWASKEKGVDVEFVEIPLDDNDPKYQRYEKEINPRGTVPALQVDDKFVFESAIIAEYFEDAYKGQGTALLPSDAYLRSQIRLFTDSFGEVSGLLYNLLRTSDAEKSQSLQKELTAKLKTVVDFLNANGKEGPFFLGRDFSLAEIMTIPFFARFSVTLKQFRSVDVFSLDPSGRLRQWYDAATSREAFKSTTAEPEYFIKGYSRYLN